MSKRLSENLSSGYLEAASHLQPKGKKRKVVVYVESYDDVFFWRALLSEVETPSLYFEVMLPSRSTLGKGKKVALMNALRDGMGKNLIACVDADYDYLLQGINDTSQMVCSHSWVFHTYAYAIENFQCYAPSLHTVCVMATLNDHHIFDFEGFLKDYSKIVFPLFVWSVWCYRYGKNNVFDLQKMAKTTLLDSINLKRPDKMLLPLQKKVNAEISWLQRNLPEAHTHLKDVEQDVLRLGVTPDTTYLYMRGHDIFEKVVEPLMTTVCRNLINEQESTIKRLASHEVQMHNEMAGYEHASASVTEMLRKHLDYRKSSLYQRIIEDIKSAVV